MGREIYILIVRFDACQRLWFGGNRVLLNKLIGLQWRPDWAKRPLEAGRFVFGAGLRPVGIMRDPQGAPVFVDEKNLESSEASRLRSVGRLAACDGCEEIVAARECPLCGEACQPIAPSC